MRRLWMAFLALLIALPLFAQAPASKWTVGTVMAIKPHVASANEAPAAAPRFDVSVRVGRTDYVVLYTEPAGVAGVDYAVGRDAPVMVGARTLSFRDKLGRQVDLPILSRMPAASQEKPR